MSDIKFNGFDYKNQNNNRRRDVIYANNINNINDSTFIEYEPIKTNMFIINIQDLLIHNYQIVEYEIEKNGYEPFYTFKIVINEIANSPFKISELDNLNNYNHKILALSHLDPTGIQIIEHTFRIVGVNYFNQSGSYKEENILKTTIVFRVEMIESN